MNFDKKNNLKQNKERLIDSLDNKLLNQPFSQEYTFDGSQATVIKEHSLVSQSHERITYLQLLKDDVSDNLKLSPDIRIRKNKPAEFGKTETDSVHNRFNSTLHKSQVSNIQRTFQDLAFDSEVASHRKNTEIEKDRQIALDGDRKSIAFGSSDLRFIESGLGQKQSEGSSPEGTNQHTFFPHSNPIYAGDIVQSHKKLQIKVNKNRVFVEDNNYISQATNRLGPNEDKKVRHTVLIPEKSTQPFSDVINSFGNDNQKISVIHPFAQNTELMQMKNRYFTPEINDNAHKNHSTYSAPSIANQADDDKEVKESTVSLEVQQFTLERIRNINKQDRFGNNLGLGLQNQINLNQSCHGQKNELSIKNYSPTKDYGMNDGLQASEEQIGDEKAKRISFCNELSTCLPLHSQLKEDDKLMLDLQTQMSSKIVNVKSEQKVEKSQKAENQLKNETDEFTRLGNEMKINKGTTRNEMNITQYYLMDKKKQRRTLIKPAIISNQNLRMHEIPPELLFYGLGTPSRDKSMPNYQFSQNNTVTQDSLDQSSFPFSPALISTNDTKLQGVNFNQTQILPDANYLTEHSSNKMFISKDNMPRKLYTAQCTRNKQMIKKSQELLDKESKRQTYLLVLSGKQQKMRTQSGMLTKSRGLALLNYKEKMKNLELLHYLKSN